MALFTFVWAIRFTSSCLSTIFFVAAMLLVAKDSHVGSRLAGSAVILGALWFGSLMAACTVHSSLPSHRHTVPPTAPSALGIYCAGQFSALVWVAHGGVRGLLLPSYPPPHRPSHHPLCSRIVGALVN